MREGKGAQDKDEDEGEVGCQDVDYRLDFDEEKGGIQSRVFHHRIEIFSVSAKEPVKDVEAQRPREGQYWAFRRTP